MIVLLQNINIEEKVKNAPDSGYEIGLVIGAYLPLILLVAFAWFLYYKSKNKNN